MKEQDLEELTISEISPRIESGAVSPLELTSLIFDRIRRLNPVLNAFITPTEEQAIAEAKRAEKEIQSRKYRGPLHGIPFSVKDNLAMKGVRTTAGSKILSEWKPDHDATVVTRLREAGAILLGKTNMHEWAMGGTTINPFYGTTFNPWDRTRIAGGSSGGSAAAVVSSMCMASIGTDNGGSVRNPASLCGVVGLKPTFGRLSHFGGVHGTGGYSTDHFGIFTKTVEDCALVLKATAGYDPLDPLSSDEPVPDYSKSIGKKVGGLKVGVIRYFEDLMVSEVKNAYEEAIQSLKSVGMIIEEVSIPNIDLIPAIWVCTSRSENVSAHYHYLRTRPRDYSQTVLHQNICALTITAETYVTAQRVRRIICQEFDEAFKRVDVIITPTGPMPAPTIEECKRGYVRVDGRELKLQSSGMNFRSLCTVPFNVTGLPALSVCCGFSALGLPIGLQIVGRPFEECMVFRVAHAYEREAEWYKKKPQLKMAN